MWERELWWLRLIHSSATHSASTCPRHRTWRWVFREAGEIITVFHCFLVHAQQRDFNSPTTDAGPWCRRRFQILPGQIEKCPVTELCLIGSGNRSESFPCFCPLAFYPLIAQPVKNLPAMQETWVQSLGREDRLEKEMATHSSILAWRIPWTEEPGGLQSMGSQESDTT